MDKNLKYVRDKRIALLLNEMVVHLLGQRPSDPLDSLVSYLEIKQQQSLAQAAKAAPAAAAAASSTPASAPAAAARATSPPKSASASPKALERPESPGKQYTRQQRDKPPPKEAEWSEPREPRERHSAQVAVDQFPVGSEVELHGVSEELDGKRARVTGHCRGRVGVQLFEFTPPMGVPPMQLRKVDDPQQKFPVGCAVEVTKDAGAEYEGYAGRVTGHARGRVGVELEDGTRVGLPPGVLRAAGISMERKFPLGSEVELADCDEEHDGKRGRVIGHRGARVGIELDDGVTVEGHPGSMLRLIGKDHVQAFPVGSEVEVVCEDGKQTQEHYGKSGKVTGHHRGRVGVELADGTKIGVPPAHLRMAKPPPPRQIPVGTEVVLCTDNAELNGRTGRVTGHARGRVGVELEDGSKVGVPPETVRVEKRPTRDFAVGAEVTVVGASDDLNGRLGRVSGRSRGRIGVVLSDDGTLVGLPPDQLKPVGKDNKQKFAVGAEVEVVASVTVTVNGEPTDMLGARGRVVGHGRGRVGVRLDNGADVGLPPDQLRAVGRMPVQRFKAGEEVQITSDNPELDGRAGRVVGAGRGRIGVSLEDGRTVGLPSAQVIPVQSFAMQQFKIGQKVIIRCEDDALDGREGEVTGCHRNRVGVRIADGVGGEHIVGVPASNVRTHQHSAVFKKDAEVEIVGASHELNGKFGRVCGRSRGRIGVHMRSGEQVGLPPDQLRLVPKFASQTFAVGQRVTFVHDDPDLKGRSGTVTGSHRNRVGVEIDDGDGTEGRIVGVPSSCLRAEPPSADQLFPKGTEVEIVDGVDEEYNGLTGFVIGKSRGRVGVELYSGTKLGLPAEKLRKAHKLANQIFKVGQQVMLVHEDQALDGKTGFVTGFHRNRVGLLLDDGKGESVPVGVPSSCVRALAPPPSQGFPVGTEVEVVSGDPDVKGLTGRVAGRARGRVGVELRNGQKVGVPPECLKRVFPMAQQHFKPGDEVDITHEDRELNGRRGRVTGTMRNRVGVEVADGQGGCRIHGLPASCLRSVPVDPGRQFKNGDLVEIVSPDVSIKGRQGKVTGKSRGRIGVELDSGEHVGVPVEHVRKAFRQACQQFKVGQLVMLAHEDAELDGLTGRVTGFQRNRVGVDVGDGKGGERTVGVPASCVRAVGAVEQDFRVGDEVEVISGDAGSSGQFGRVTARARGRIGVQLRTGETLGLPAARLRHVALFAEQQVKVGDHVCIVHDDPKLDGNCGYVTGTHRNRVGVQIDDGKGGHGETVGLPASCVKLFTKKDGLHTFQVGDEVEIASDNLDINGKLGRVSGKARGRVGVHLHNGQMVGVPPEQCRRLKKEPAQEFQVGVQVEVVGEDATLSGRIGRVTGRHRGRVGVSLENGEQVGVPAGQLRVHQGTAAGELFKVGDEVEVRAGEHSGKMGRVSGMARGRVGVALNDGATIGCCAANLGKTGKMAAQQFRHGDIVEILGADVQLGGQTGSVTGTSRGRVGVALHSTGAVVGVPAEHVRAPAKEADAAFPLGSRVVVTRVAHADCGSLGKVIGHVRGRVRVCLDPEGEEGEGKNVGLPPDMLALAPAPPDQQFPANARVQIVNDDPELSGQVGMVIGHGRGRVGVELSDGKRVGLPPASLRPAERTPGDIPVGTKVEVTQAEDPSIVGAQGEVTYHSRGRCAVLLSGDEGDRKVGLPVSTLRVIPGPLKEAFAEGAEVEYTAHAGAQVRKGKVTGHGRGRVGVELEGGDKVGALPAQLKLA